MPKASQVKRASGLTELEETFAMEYLANGGDALKAYHKARPLASHQTCMVNGARMRRRPRVDAYIEARLAKRLKQLDITAERIDLELARIALSDLRRCFSGGQLRAIESLPDDVAAAISSVEVVVKPDGSGGVEYVHKIRQWDKPRSLETLLKRLGLLREKLDVHHGGRVALDNIPMATDDELNTRLAELARKQAQSDPSATHGTD